MCWRAREMYLRKENQSVTSNSLNSVQFSSAAQSCPTLCDSMNCLTAGLSVLHQLLELAQTHIHWVMMLTNHDLVQHQGFFPMSWLFASCGQSMGASASASVLPVNIQGWFPLGLTGLISLLSIKLWDTDSHLTCKTLFKICGLPESGSYLRDISTVVYLRSKRVLNRK